MNTLLDYVNGANPPYELQKIDTIFIWFFLEIKCSTKIFYSKFYT